MTSIDYPDNDTFTELLLSQSAIKSLTASSLLITPEALEVLEGRFF